MGQHRPNIGQHGPNIGPTWAQDDPNIAQHSMGPTWPNISPRWAQDGSTWARLGPTRLLPYRQALRIMPASVQHSPPWVCAENLGPIFPHHCSAGARLSGVSKFDLFSIFLGASPRHHGAQRRSPPSSPVRN